MKQEKPSIVSPCEGGGIIPPSVKSVKSVKSVYIRVIRGTILNPLC